MQLPERGGPQGPGRMSGGCWNGTDDERYHPLVRFFTNPLTTSWSIRTTPYTFTANRRRSWRSARLVASSRSLLERGGSRWLRRSPRLAASRTAWLTQHRYFSIAAKPATLQRRWESTVRHFRG